MHFDNGWQGFSYEWNSAQDEAVLIDEAKVIDAGDFQHTIPSRSQCFECHTNSAGVSLGLEARQQHIQSLSLGANFLDFLSQTYLQAAIDKTQVEPLASLADTTASLEHRARSYLHSNCSSCHRPGETGSLMDLRFSTPLASTGICNVDSSSVNNAKRIAPGDADNSVLLQRMLSTHTDRMPPLASLKVDETATAVIRNWIDNLQRCES